jgi:hypothetical protein
MEQETRMISPHTAYYSTVNKFNEAKVALTSFYGK